MSFNESSKVVILYTVLGVHENAMKNFLPKHYVLRWLYRVFFTARDLVPNMARAIKISLSKTIMAARYDRTIHIKYERGG